MSGSESKDNVKTKEKLCRVVIQQCIKADLKFDTSDNPVSINRGIVVFVCFLQGATLTSVEHIAKSILWARLCEADDDTPGRKGPLELAECDILLIPQATLGGRLKGKNAQYHGIVSKQLGAELFSQLVLDIKQLVEIPQKGQVQAGIYGARQILSMQTNGPYTHVFDF